MNTDYTQEQLEIIDYYHANNMAKLKKICDPIIFRKGVPKMDWDDLYDVASDTLLESLESYDDSKGSKFCTYLTGNINRAFYDWTRDKLRGKRCNVERDEHGQIKRDANHMPIVISDISFDAPTEDGIDLREKIASDFNIESELVEEIGIFSGNKMKKYLEKLSNKQQKIAFYLSDGYKPSEIRKLLHITEKEYSDCMLAISAYKNIKILM